MYTICIKMTIEITDVLLKSNMHTVNSNLANVHLLYYYHCTLILAGYQLHNIITTEYTMYLINLSKAIATIWFSLFFFQLKQKLDPFIIDCFQMTSKDCSWYTVELTNNSLDKVQHHCNLTLFSNILPVLVQTGSKANRGELMCTSLCACIQTDKLEQPSQWTQAPRHFKTPYEGGRTQRLTPSPVIILQSIQRLRRR